MRPPLLHLEAQTFHRRKGGVGNQFRYKVDYIWLNAEAAPLPKPRLFSRNRGNVMALHDRDHGGPPKAGRGAAWVREILTTQNIAAPARIDLLAQPRVLGQAFNPVAFWLCWDSQDTLRAAIAEVNNTYGERHSYLIHRADHGPITPQDTLRAQKIFYVSPFQPIEGHYDFRFDIRPDRLGIWIDYTHANGGIFTNVVGTCHRLSNARILSAVLRLHRVLGLIHWQAFRLWRKGVAFRNRPRPPKNEIRK